MLSANVQCAVCTHCVYSTVVCADTRSSPTYKLNLPFKSRSPRLPPEGAGAARSLQES